MSVDLMPSASLAGLEDQLSLFRNELVNMQGTRDASYIQKYFDLINTQQRILRPSISPRMLERLLFTPQYWAARWNHNTFTYPVLYADLEDRLLTVLGLIEEVQALRRRWSLPTGLILIPDTNFYLHHERAFWEVDWKALATWQSDVHIVVPWKVVNELDRAKSDKVRSRARLTIKQLFRQLPDDVGQRQVIEPEPGKVVAGVTIEALVPDRDHEPLPTADEEIVDQARILKDVSRRPLRIVTEDVGMKLIARREGVDVLAIEPDLSQQS